MQLRGHLAIFLLSGSICSFAGLCRECRLEKSVDTGISQKFEALEPPMTLCASTDVKGRIA